MAVRFAPVVQDMSQRPCLESKSCIAVVRAAGPVGAWANPYDIPPSSAALPPAAVVSTQTWRS